MIIDEICNDKNIETSDIEVETFDNIEELVFPQEHDSNQPIVVFLDDLNEKEVSSPKVESMFKRSRYNNISIFRIDQDYYDLPKKYDCCNGSIYHIVKPNNFRDVQNLYQDKASMD